MTSRNKLITPYPYRFSNDFCEYEVVVFGNAHRPVCFLPYLEYGSRAANRMWRDLELPIKETLRVAVMWDLGFS